MKNLKEIKLMMERLESPRLTDTELQRKMSLLKEEEGQNKMASEEQLEFMVDRIPATLSVKGVSNYELEKLISQNKMKMNFMNGVIAWVDKDSKLYQMGKDSRILNGVDRTNEIINHLESKGYTQSPDVPVY